MWLISGLEPRPDVFDEHRISLLGMLVTKEN